MSLVAVRRSVTFRLPLNRLLNFRNDSVDLLLPDRQARLRLVRAAAESDGVGDRLSGVEEVADVVRMRDPRCAVGRVELGAGNAGVVDVGEERIRGRAGH